MADNTTNIDILINTANSANNVRDLRKALKDLVSAQESVDKSSPDFTKLAEGINQTESRIGDLNDSFKTLAGSGMERLTTSTYLLKDGLNNLDLDKLQIAMGGLKQLPKALAGEFTKLTGVVNKLNFKSLGASMKDLGKSGVGELTKSIVQLGKAILTNPILLLAGVIIGLVAVVVKFYDKIIPLRIAVEAFGAVVDAVVQSLKDFADWIGITDFAGDEAATNQIKRNERLLKDAEQKYDKEVGLAQAAGQKTTDIEIKREKEIRSILDKEVANLTDRLNRKLIKQEEYDDKLWEIHDKYVESKDKEAVLEVKREKEITDKNKEELEKRLKKWEDFNKAKTEATKKANDLIYESNQKLLDNEETQLKNATEKAYTDKKLALEKDLKEGTLSKEKYDEAIKTADKALKKDLELIDRDFRIKTLKADADAEEAYVDTIQKSREFLSKRAGEGTYISAKELEVKLNENQGVYKKKEDEYLQIKKDAQDELKKFDEARIGQVLSADDKEKRIRLESAATIASSQLETFKIEYAQKRDDLLNSFRKKDIEQEIAATEIKLAKVKEGSKEELDAKKQLIEQRAKIDILNTDLTEKEKQAIIAKSVKESSDLEIEYAKKTNLEIVSLTDKYLSEKGKKTVDAIKQIASGVNSILSEAADLMAQNAAQELSEYDRIQQAKIDSFKSANAQMEQDFSDNQAIQLANFTGTEEEKNALQNQFAQEKVKRDNEVKMAEYEMALEKYNFDLSMKKKAFETNKKMQIASAIISGALAVVNGLTTQPFIPAGIIAAATAAITAGISIAKIASTQFQDTGSPPQKPVLANPAAVGLSGGSSTGSSVGASGGNISAPTFYKLGQGGSDVGGKMSQRVYVLESDITKIQKGVQRVETRATTTL